MPLFAYKIVDANGKEKKGTIEPECGYSGYKGRSGIFELLMIDEEIRRAVVARQDASDIRRIAASNGMLNLREDGALKAIKGITSPEEVLLRTQEDK